MLVLTRKKGESIIIGDEIEIVIVEISPGQVRLGIKAPRKMTVLRKEIYEEVGLENKKAASLEHNKEDLQEYLKNELQGILQRGKKQKDR